MVIIVFCLDSHSLVLEGTDMIDLDLELIQQQAIEAYPNEAIWFVTDDGCYQVENIHEDPENFFLASAADSLQAIQNNLKAVIHSHCDGYPVPSAEDMRLHEKLAVPCGILETNGISATEISWMSKLLKPLEGRSFMHGISDCFSIVKDYYTLRGVNLEEVPRDWLWWEKGDNFLEELFSSRGFVEVQANEAREGDAWVAQIRGPVIHHCGILLGNDLILHHPGSGDPVDRTKLSIQEPIYRYLPYIKKFLRHKELA